MPIIAPSSSPMPSLTRSFALNTHGRDFTVSDIHGCFSLLRQALHMVSFDPTMDRLFALGDLVNRGPESAQVLDFLAKHVSLCGNHEDMLLSAQARHKLLRGPPPPWFAWLTFVPRARWPDYVEAFRKLPIAIEVETELGLMGLVHADVPPEMNWTNYKAALDRPVSRFNITIYSLWTPGRVTQKKTAPVSGLDRLYVGHTEVERITVVDNVYHIDTCAVYGLLGEKPGRLTLAELTTPDFTDLRYRRREGLVDVYTRKPW